jgi:acetolactate decarboxylase
LRSTTFAGRRRRAAAIAAAALLAACAAEPSARLRQYGAMRAVMREGHVEPRVRLADLDLGPRTIAVGALAGLQGEVTVVDGTVYVATAAAMTADVTTGPGDASATLLSVATPPATAAQTSAQALGEAELEQIVRADGMLAAVDVVGAAEELHLHIARGACPHGQVNDAAAPFRWQAQPGTQVRLVGIFAQGEAGTLTHHGTPFHLHAVATTAQGERIAGHVDRFLLRPGAEVRHAPLRR